MTLEVANRENEPQEAQFERFRGLALEWPNLVIPPGPGKCEVNDFSINVWVAINENKEGQGGLCGARALSALSNFEHFLALAPAVARIGLKSLILSTSGLGSRRVRKRPQEAQFEHFQALPAEVARIGLRRLILSTFKPWPQKLPE